MGSVILPKHIRDTVEKVACSLQVVLLYCSQQAEQSSCTVNVLKILIRSVILAMRIRRVQTNVQAGGHYCAVTASGHLIYK